MTGGCGFVGRNLIKALINEGNNQVICVDSMEPFSGCIEPNRWPEICPLDFRNFEFIRMDCRDFFKADCSYFDEIFHLAAMVGGRLNHRLPIERKAEA